MLDRRDDHFVAVGVRSQSRADRRVVALRAAGGEQDFVGEAGADERRDLVAGGLHPLPAWRAEGVRRRRVAEVLGEERQHRRDHLGIDARRGVVVQIDRPHGASPQMGTTLTGKPSFSMSFMRTPSTVIEASWHPAQAPVIRTRTTSPSTPTNWQSPPSALRRGRSSASAASIAARCSGLSRLRAGRGAQAGPAGSRRSRHGRDGAACR